MRLEVRLELSKDAIVEMRLDVRTGEGMGFAGIDLEVVGNAGLNELLHELRRILEVHVVVARAVDEQQPALEIGGGIDYGEVSVASGKD